VILVVAAAGGVSGSQLPEYARQYRQQETRRAEPPRGRIAEEVDGRALSWSCARRGSRPAPAAQAARLRGEGRLHRERGRQTTSDKRGRTVSKEEIDR